MAMDTNLTPYQVDQIPHEINRFILLAVVPFVLAVAVPITAAFLDWPIGIATYFAGAMIVLLIYSTFHLGILLHFGTTQWLIVVLFLFVLPWGSAGITSLFRETIKGNVGLIAIIVAIPLVSWGILSAFMIKKAVDARTEQGEEYEPQ